MIFPTSTTMAKPLLNKKQLAEQLGRTATYVSGMVRCGYVPKYGTKTTLKHALEWLAERPDFRVEKAYPSMAATRLSRKRQDPQLAA
jgi:hypothetical protein